MTTKIPTSDPADPVFVDTIGQRIELRIGYPARGETRLVMLKLSEARKVAEALISHADSLAEANRRKKEISDMRLSGQLPEGF